MADAIVQLVTDSANTGKDVDCSSLTVGANTTYRQRINIADPTGATGLASVLGTLPASGAFGLTVRPLVATDGTNSTPTMDAIARAGFQELTDGTNGPVAVKAASTIAAAADKALVVSLSPNSPPVGQFLAYGSLPALTTGQSAPLMTDSPGNLKVAVSPLGTPIYAGSGASGGAAAANSTLTIPAAKMGYLDGFDIDGLGATAGSAIAVTVTGLLGGTLTYEVGIPAGITTPFTYSKRFNPPLQASAVATNIVVNVPSFGVGNTQSSSVAYGHYV